MRVDDRHALAEREISFDEIREKRGLARAGAADGEEVKTAVVSFYAKDAIIVAEVDAGECVDRVIHGLKMTTSKTGGSKSSAM